MASIDDRLAPLFRIAFPALGDAPVDHATTSNVDLWDSVMTLTLIALVEEEFGVWIGYDRLSALSTYQAFRALLIERGVSPEGVAS